LAELSGDLVLGEGGVDHGVSFVPVGIFSRT
jgi:hypothetical protein